MFIISSDLLFLLELYNLYQSQKCLKNKYLMDRFFPLCDVECYLFFP
jgi:hypothetical protein